MIIERTRLKEKLQSETYGTNSTRFNFRRQVKRQIWLADDEDVFVNTLVRIYREI